jgi:hypothetical protein
MKWKWVYKGNNDGQGTKERGWRQKTFSPM